MDVNGKVVLVTGAAGGIGFACCHSLLSSGVKGVTIVDVEEQKGHDAVKKLEEEFGKGRAIFIKADVTKQKNLEDAFDTTKDTFQGLDIVVNNAGMCNEADGAWECEIELNVKGVVRGTLLAMERLPRGSAVVNMASIAGLMELEVLPVYCATKHAVVGFTRSMGAQFHMERSGVRVMAICPGATVTPIIHDPHNYLMSSDWAEHMRETMAGFKPQEAANVGRGVVQLLREGTSGSVWVCEDGQEAYPLKFPFYQDMKTTE